MRVVVTRPQDDAARWVQDLADAQIDAISLPLIEIQPVPGFDLLRAAWQEIGRFDAVMFVSAAAVNHFFAATATAGASWPSGSALRAWAPGPGTAAALLRHGVPAERIDAPAPDSGQFDSESLWRVVGPGVRSGQRVLIVRGADDDAGAARLTSNPARLEPPMPAGGKGQGRDWLAQRLAEAAVSVAYVVAYRRVAPQPQQLRQAVARIGPSACWLFTSSQAIQALVAALPGHDWSRARALVTHPRIGAAARAAGFGVVQESRPALADLVSSIKSGG